MLLEHVAEFKVLAKHDLFLIRLTGPYALFVRQSEWPEVRTNSLCLIAVLYATGGAAHKRVRLLSPGICLGPEGNVSVCPDSAWRRTEHRACQSTSVPAACRTFLLHSFASGSVKKWTRPLCATTLQRLCKVLEVLPRLWRNLTHLHSDGGPFTLAV